MGSDFLCVVELSVVSLCVTLCPSVVRIFKKALTTEDTELHRGKTHRELFIA